MVKAETCAQPGGAEAAAVNNLKRWLSVRKQAHASLEETCAQTVATVRNRQMRERTHILRTSRQVCGALVLSSLMSV